MKQKLSDKRGREKSLYLLCYNGHKNAIMGIKCKVVV